ncbi:MAG: hypothetical protein J5643_02135 [Lachnospiraceae bacterium]|nr:hypothetical protein [Lachnospiraceae bacterium]
MTGFDLNKAMTDIDERFIEEAEYGGRDTLVTSGTGTEKKSGRKVFRVVLIAACLTALLAGTVAAGNKVLKQNRFLDTIGSESGPEELGDAYIPMNITKEGPVKVTLENIIGDMDAVYCEFSTDVLLGDCPDGWIMDMETGVRVTMSGKALLPEEENVGGANGLSPFCRNGRLWYLLSISYTGWGVDISHMPMQVKVSAYNKNDGSKETYQFEWTNNYTAVKKTIPVDVKFDKYKLTSVDLSVTRLIIRSELNADEDFPKLTLDYVKLEDGTVWEYFEEGGPMVKHTGVGTRDGETGEYSRIFGLIGEFTEKETGANNVVPYDKIVAISVNGTEISLR